MTAWKHVKEKKVTEENAFVAPLKFIAEQAERAKMLETITVDGRIFYVDRRGDLEELVPSKTAHLNPHPRGCKMMTLEGVVGFAGEVTELAQFIRVDENGAVAVHGLLRPEDGSRPQLVDAAPRRWHLNDRMDQESFLLELSQKFHETVELTKLLELCGNIRGEEVETQVDDGVTQEVSVRKGVRLQMEAVKRFWTLKARCGFPCGTGDADIRFVLRINKKDKGGFTFRLLEADGGKWQQERAMAIAEKLRELVGEGGLPVYV